jgi:phage terminase small subunit
MAKAIVPLIQLDDGDLGPAMSALNAGERAFVIGKVHHGLNNADAAAQAGYSTKGENAKTVGYRLAHSERVCAAIIEQSKRVLKSEGPKSINVLVAIRDSQKEDARDRIKAAVELLNRGGLSVVQEQHVTHDHTFYLTPAQKDARIVALGKEFGLDDDAIKKLVTDPNVIDAEFSEVAAPPKELSANPENVRRRELRAASPEARAELKRQKNEERRQRMKAKRAAAEGKQLDIEDAITASPASDDLSDLYA